jgi:hypothetical protein
MLLLLVDQRASMQKMCEVTGLKSTSSIQYRLQNLASIGLVIEPAKRKAARSRTLSENARRLLEAHGHTLANNRDPGITDRFLR